MNKMSSQTNTDHDKIYLAWLKNKFKTLENLNKSCKGNFASFEKFIECSEKIFTAKDEEEEEEECEGGTNCSTQTDTQENEYYDTNNNVPNVVVSPRSHNKQKNPSYLYNLDKF